MNANELDDRLARLGRVGSPDCDLATDAMMAMTGASFASGRIPVRPTDGPRPARFFARDQRLTLAIE